MRSTPSSRRLAQLALLAIVALAAAAISVAAATGGHSQGGRDEPVSWRGLVGGPRPEVPVGQRMIVVLRTPSLAARVAAAGGRASEADERRWHTAAEAAQRQLIARLSVEGLRLRPEFTYSRVISGFSAPLDARAVALLQRFPEVEGVYPVRIAYPASTTSELVERRRLAPGSGVRARLALPGYTGRGVTIALLDTGVQHGHDYLAGAVLEGVDVLENDDLASAEPRPDEPGEVERHGTQLAGLIVGSGGPGGLTGVAEHATILPIRVAGWQRDVAGRWAVYSRTDQLIAGLERAVDPNGDGSAHDAARIAVIGVAEPFAAFADSPSARAVTGAVSLDTLVVAPAGNDGPAGPRYGSVSGPGGSREALTVGAADDRRTTEHVRVTIRTGLRLVFDGEVPLGGAREPGRSLTLDLAGPAPRDRLLPEVLGRGEPAVSVADFFDRNGYSLVAGKAALAPAGDAPDAAAAGAARAGAAAVVLHDARIPAGSLGADERIGVPVVSVPAGAARAALRLLRAGQPATVEIGAPRERANPNAGQAAAFSSDGLAFDGGAKPELVAPGVALLTSHPGREADGRPAFGTVSGSSAAAAVVAGGAARLAQMRPDLDAQALHGALVGTAREVDGVMRMDLGAAAAVEVVAAPATVALGHANRRGWQGAAHFTVRNVSERPLGITVSTGRLGEVGGAALAVSPGRFTLAPRSARKVFLVARMAYMPPRVRLIAAVLELQAGGAAPVRVPWTLTLGPYERNLLGGVRLSTNRFRPSDSAPALLELRAGRLVDERGLREVLPLSHLDLELWRGRERIGRLARLRNLLPGRYTFGLTGRGPAGRRLSPGRYTLRLIAYPPGEAPPSRQFVQFTIS
ncbi:MAG TPA: S8 family serine peptidase [Gaiellaceae bacterium]|nr:S8 family serine peptidase [Gaiellaceae bacterium]